MRKTIARRFLWINGPLVLYSLFYAALFLYLRERNPQAMACAFQEATGLYCPGCGGSRSLLALLSLDFVKSFLYLPALPLTALLLLAMDITYAYGFIKDDITPVRRFPYKLFFLPLAVLILWFFLRNHLFFTIGYDPIGDLLKRHGPILCGGF